MLSPIVGPAQARWQGVGAVRWQRRPPGQRIVEHKPQTLGIHGGDGRNARGAGGTARHPTVTATQIALTILDVLDLDPRRLPAVRLEGTTALPGLRD
ncbi:MAG TPA: hypothetical protein VES01_08625 [Dermatophilaceae bacterium]|nr:hypothetical protein [Dermatophilaceae bacterium]